MIRRAYKVVNPRGKWNTGIFNYARNLATYKTSTGLVGLEVDPEGKTTLLNLSGDVLESVKKIPEHSEYRKNVEKWFKYISAECSKTDDIKAIEHSMEIGQIEEVIEMAKDELKLVDFYYENKMWDMVVEEQKEADKKVLEMADVLYFTDPDNHPAKKLEEEKK